MQSVVPVLTLAASPSDQVETDARFPQDEYFLQTEHLRIGWLGDAIGADAIRRTHHRTAASDPSAPAWTLPLYPTVRLIRSATTRVPTVSSCADVMNTVITAPTLDVAAGPFEPTLHWQNAITTVFRWIQNKLPHRPPVIFRDSAKSAYLPSRRPPSPSRRTEGPLCKGSSGGPVRRDASRAELNHLQKFFVMK